MHDLTVLPSGKPAIQYGPPGRSASTGHTATVFGCTSFLGRYLVAKLGMCPYLALLLSCRLGAGMSVNVCWGATQQRQAPTSSFLTATRTRRGF